MLDGPLILEFMTYGDHPGSHRYSTSEADVLAQFRDVFNQLADGKDTRKLKSGYDSMNDGVFICEPYSFSYEKGDFEEYKDMYYIEMHSGGKEQYLLVPVGSEAGIAIEELTDVMRKHPEKEETAMSQGPLELQIDDYEASPEPAHYTYQTEDPEILALFNDVYQTLLESEDRNVIDPYDSLWEGRFACSEQFFTYEKGDFAEYKDMYYIEVLGRDEELAMVIPIGSETGRKINALIDAVRGTEEK